MDAVVLSGVLPMIKRRQFRILVLSCLGMMVLLSFTHIFTSSPTLRIEKSEEIFVSTKNKLLSISSPSTRPTLFVANKTKHSTGGKTGAPDSVYDNKIYVMAAYVTSSSLIKLTTIRKCKLPVRLRLRLQVNATSFLTIQMLQHPIIGCPWFFAAKCDFVGFFALTVKNKNMEQLLSESQETLPKAYLSRTDKPSLLIPIKLKDARVIASGPRKHNLAVCLQPIFLLADWTLLVQFFEIWIAQGATKFYVYVQSVAPEVDALLRVYEHSSDADVERISWAPLPTSFGDPGDSDPNLRVYRTEVVTSINDCVLRSRGHAKYVVSSDLDEIIVARGGTSLLEMLDKLRSKSKKVGAFVIRSSFALYENQWANISQPDDIDFNGFANISLENYVWRVGYRSKVIMVPEYIYSTHVHEILQPERIAKGVRILAPDIALVFHLRRVMNDDMWSTNSTKNTNALAKFIDPCNKSWKNRLKIIAKIPDTRILQGSNWPNRGTQVMKEMEACRLDLVAQQNETCASPYRCITKITTVKESEWIFAQQTWTVL